MTTGQGGWNRFWFAPASLVRLGAWRALVCALALHDVLLYRGLVLHDAARVSSGDLGRSWNPIYLFDLLGLGPIGIDTAQLVLVATVVSLTLAACGVASRLSCAAGALLFLYWTGLAYSFAKPHHDKIALAFAISILPFAPVGARVSVDAIVAAMRGRTLPETSELARFPIRFAQLAIAIGYFFAGASKLWIGGIDWFNGYTLQGIMLGHDNEWSRFFAQSVLGCQVQSIGVVATQVLFPLVFVWRASRWFFLPAATAFHLMTWLTMDTGPYMRLWLLLAAFLPLERVPAAVRRALGERPVTLRGAATLAAAVVVPVLVVRIVAHSAPTWVVLLGFAPLLAAGLLYVLDLAPLRFWFDGACPLCRRTVALLRGIDQGRRLSFVDFRSSDPTVVGLDPARLERDVAATDAAGRARFGLDAYRTVAWRVPWLWPVAPLAYLPPFSTLAALVYRRIADTRLRCVGGACELVSQDPGAPSRVRGDELP